MTDLPSWVKRGAPFETGRTIEAVIKNGLTSVRKYERDGRIYAGQAGFCPRQTTLISTFSGEVIEGAESQGYFALGNAIEELVMKGLKNQDRVLFQQYKTVEIGLNLGGKIDAIIVHDNRLRLLEVKSCGQIPGSPKPEHVAQARMYEAITGLKGVILYFSRTVADWHGNLKIKCFELNSSQSDLQVVMFNAVYGRIAIDRKVIPPRPSFKNEGICGFCNFIPYCWHKEEISSTFTPVTAGIHREITEEAAEFTKNVLADSVVKARRNGILRHIEEFGLPPAQSLLKERDWESLL